MKITNLLENKTPHEKAGIKAQEIVKLDIKGDYKEPKYGIDMKIHSVKTSEKGGIEVMAQGWKDGKQMGFGDGTVDIERFIFPNPRILVPDGTKREVISELIGAEMIDNFIEDPIQALQLSLAHTMLVAGNMEDRIIPGSVGRSTLTVYPDASSGATSVDATVGIDNGVGKTWAQIRVATANFVNKTGATNQVWYIVGDGTNTFSTLARSIYTFDTSSLTAGATISAATLSLFGSSVRTDAASPQTNIVASTPASDNDVVTGDFAQLGSTAFSTAITQAGWSTSAYNDFALNASGLSNIDKTGVSTFGGIEDVYDRGNTDPGDFTAGGLAHASCYHADQAGTTNDPKLVVTYTAASNVIKDIIQMGLIYPRA